MLYYNTGELYMDETKIERVDEKGRTGKQIAQLFRENKISPEHINKFIEKVNFDEEFLREFKDYIKWSTAFIWQQTSREFIREICTEDDVLSVLFGSNVAKNDSHFSAELEMKFGYGYHDYQE